jgi:hypothetical protein
MRTFLSAGVAVILLAGAGCAAAPSVDLSVARFSSGPAPFEATSGFAAPANVVVRDDQQWEALWNTIYARTSPRPALPSVDFTRYLIIARAMGPRATGGYAVVIAGLLRQGREYVVQVRETSPGSGCVVTPAETSPVDVARIARHDEPIKFAVASETRPCVGDE